MTMPEEDHTTESRELGKINNALKILEGQSKSPAIRVANYATIQKALVSCGYVNADIASRLMVLCTRDLNENVNPSNCLLIIDEIINKVKNGQIPTTIRLTPLALTIIDVCFAYLKQNEALKNSAINTLLSFPPDTITNLALYHFKNIENYFEQDQSLQICIIVNKLLNTIPPDKKKQFVKKETQFWFKTLIPKSMFLIVKHPDDVVIIETLEILSESLMEVDYSNNNHWLDVLDCISKSSRYPAIIKSLLEKQNINWHRLWIVFIKLLKNQITKVCSPGGSPINSMLPTVECAFKMDADNRCRAFQCWNVLIDNFSTETNDLVVTKRVKLLIIPLRSNNAKIEQTAMAKFNTWWHLFRRFQLHIDKFADAILVPFLHFCFGKHTQQDKSYAAPGRISDKLRYQCVQAFVELFGHNDCNGCTTLPKLSNKLVNTRMLTSFWDDWKYSMQEVLKYLLISKDITLSRQQGLCVFKSILATLLELPDNNIRKDLVDHVTNIWLDFIKKNIHAAQTLLLILDVVTPAIIDDKYKKLFKMKDDKQARFRNVVSLILEALFNFKDRDTNQELIQKLKPLTMHWISENKSTTETVNFFVKNLLIEENCWPMWLLVTDSVFESSCKNNTSVNTDLYLWPLKAKNLINMDKCINDVQYAAAVWTNSYNSEPTIDKVNLSNELYELLKVNELTHSAHYFLLTLSFTILKKKMTLNEKTTCVKEAEFIEKVLLKMKDHDDTKKLLPISIDTAVLMLSNISETEDKNFAKHVLSIVSSILKLINTSEISLDEDNFTGFFNNLVMQVEKVFQKEAYNDMKGLLVDDVIDCHKKFSTCLSIKNSTTSLLKLFLSQSKNQSDYCDKIKSVLDSPKANSKKDTPAKVTETFVAPEKKTQKKKKEVSIVNKVVEDGEEYVVVKSNWKFNPRNLTENQKEKMKRKREDIPALYQDLSQSQDEFKLSTWKTDSQDTLNTSSKSTSKCGDGEATTILKNIPSSEVVPRIFENLMTETVKDYEETKADPTATKVESPASKPKTPRMALKDRVFRNVRNLMEKSSLQQGKSEKKPSDKVSVPASENTVPRTPNSRITTMMNLVNSASASQTFSEKRSLSDQNNTTPLTKQKMNPEVLSSAPPALSTERPSRIKRKPKKFDDVQLLDLKRRRHSLNNSQTEAQVENEVTKDEILKDDVTMELVQPTAISTESGKDQVIPESNQDVAANQDTPDIVTTPVKDKLGDKPENTKLPIEEVAQKNCEVITENIICTDAKEPINAVLDESKSLLTPKAKSKKDVETSKTATKLSPSSSDTSKSPIDSSESVNAVLDQSKSLLTPKAKLKKVGTASKSESKQSRSSDENENQEPLINAMKESQLELEESQSQEEVCETPKKSDDNLLSSRKKKSRIEKELAIDMVLPFSSTTEKRVRKKLNDTITPKRKYVKKTDKSSADTNTPKSAKKSNNKDSDVSPKSATVVVNETQDKDAVDESPFSEDIIESSQDSTVTTISMKSTKSARRIPVVSLEKHRLSDELIKSTPSLLENFDNASLGNETHEDKSKSDCNNDSVMPCNKTAVLDNTGNVTATKDTEPTDSQSSSDVIIISEDIAPPVSISSDDACIELNTEDVANADTQTMDPNIFSLDINKNNDVTISLNTQEDATKTFNQNLDDDNTSLSPSKAKRKQDFLNNTLEISPIKIQSPIREEKTPSPETSNDYVVIKLSSPVHSNGEPFEKCDSPEIFTEDKVSPDKRDLSPPRESVLVKNSSPSSSLSLKKNRPQVRASGRAAQMLDLCVPDNQKTLNTKKDTTDESKKTSTSTPVRRNLRMIYTSIADNTSENMDESDESEQFLNFKKTLPPVDSSPAGPILKRKLAEIADDATISPASKRKRVSFHDPPVSTTIQVRKYIEPLGTRSPSNSAIKRQERQTRSQANMKSPKRLDNVFKLDTALTKTAESFTENDVSIVSTDDTEMSSIDQTPVVEIVKISDLNDTDPICPELVDCNDPISNITSELSSPSLSSLLAKKFMGNIETIGDLAKLTELEVNRLCIKVPKVAVARKVLNDYLSKKKAKTISEVEILDLVEEKSYIDAENQTDELNKVINSNMEIQTDIVSTSTTAVQCMTEVVSTVVQTDESGSKSTKDVLSELKEKPDFVNCLTSILDETASSVAASLPLDCVTKMLINRLNTANSKDILDQVIKKNVSTDGDQLKFVEDYLSEKFKSKDLILLCSNLLRKAYDKPL